MKRNLYILSVAVLASVLCSCQKDDLLREVSDSHDELLLTVTDGGYAPSDATTLHTRAAENGYRTTFTAGDRIGLFAVKNGKIDSSVNNLCLTATAATSGTATGGLVWTDTNGKALPDIPGATYYAYYPWQETLNGTPAANASEASGFFADVISNWTPVTVQDTYAAYTAQDLMTAQGEISNKSLALSMQHRMALVVIDLPKTKYTFGNTPKIPDYVIDAPYTRFNSSLPCRMNDGTYRYLVKPSANTMLSGRYTNASSVEVAWNFTARDLSAGNYKIVKVDGGSATVIEKSHTLAVGDFYMRDGSLLAGSTPKLSIEQQAECIGIVYSMDVDRIGAAARKALLDKGVDTPRALVMALTNASSCRWGNNGTDENSDGSGGEPFKNNTDQLKKQYENVDGYGETNWIIKNYGGRGAALQDTYTAFYHAARYGTAANDAKRYAAPTHTTGWFIPSMGQWWDILSNLGKVDLTGHRNSAQNGTSISGAAATAVSNMNGYLDKITESTKFRVGTYLWSSSEYSGQSACLVGLYSDDTLRLSSTAKDYGYGSVRCSLAF